MQDWTGQTPAVSLGPGYPAGLGWGLKGDCSSGQHTSLWGTASWTCSDLSAPPSH